MPELLTPPFSETDGISRSDHQLCGRFGPAPQRARRLSARSLGHIDRSGLGADRGVGYFDSRETLIILVALREIPWVVRGLTGAAARLGMKRSMLYWKMKKLGISRPE